jgi:hypothetical protein
MEVYCAGEKTRMWCLLLSDITDKAGHDFWLRIYRQRVLCRTFRLLKHVSTLLTSWVQFPMMLSPSNDIRCLPCYI